MKQSLEGCVKILMTSSSPYTPQQHMNGKRLFKSPSNFTSQSLTFREDENIDEFSVESQTHTTTQKVDQQEDLEQKTLMGSKVTYNSSQEEIT